MKSMNLTKLQKERLIQLLGSRFFWDLILNRYFCIGGFRYKPNSEVMALTCEMYPTMQENYQKLLEMIKEIYLEAKRAP